MMGYDGYGYRMMGYGGGWIMMIGVLIIIVLAVVALVHYFPRTRQTNIDSSQSNAINILDERYAKGEINDEEYRKKKVEMKS